MSVFQIRMNPGFFADPDLGFKVRNKTMGSRCFWLGFRGTWPKRTVLRVLNMKLKKFVYLFLQFFLLFLHGSGSGFSRIGSGFLADSDRELGKNPDPKPVLRSRSRPFWLDPEPWKKGRLQASALTPWLKKRNKSVPLSKVLEEQSKTFVPTFLWIKQAPVNWEVNF